MDKAGEQGACCSHLTVTYRTKPADGWAVSGFWACQDCGHELFWPVQELVTTAAKLLEWQPDYSVGSSGYLRSEKLRSALKKFGKDGSLNQAVGVEADLKHPGNNTGGEIAELIDRITPENQHIPERSPEPRLGLCDKGLVTPHTETIKCVNWRGTERVGESPAPATHVRFLDNGEIDDEPTEAELEAERVAAPPEPATLKECTRCHTGIDDNGDGDCRFCAGIPEKFTSLLHVIFQKGEKVGQAKVSTLEQALRTALIPLAALVLSGECTTDASALCEDLKADIIKGHDAILAALSGESRQ